MTQFDEAIELEYFRGLDQITKSHGSRPYVGGAFLVGSHGYGLATPESDIDIRGFYVARTQDILGLKDHSEQLEAADGDMTLFEVSKFIRLALKANPNVVEVLWADPIYATDYAKLMIANRQEFLSEPAVRNAYAGYAMGQFKRALKEPHRKQKAYRHMFRLYEQGMDLLTTGTMDYQVRDPEKMHEMARWDDEKVEREFKKLDRQFAAANSELPSRGNWNLMNSILLDIRKDRW